MRKFSAPEQQTISSFASGLSAAILLIVLMSLVLFIVLKGSAYFWPSQVFKVTTYDTPNSEVSVFVPSSVNIDEFNQALSDKLDAQFSNSALPMPLIVVEKVDAVYQISLNLGAIQYGNFQQVNTPNSERYQLAELNDVVADVAIFQNQLHDIQTNYLTVLHRKIALLNQSGVGEEAPARLKELEQFTYWQQKAETLRHKLASYNLIFIDAAGQPFDVLVKDIDHLFQPNVMSLFDKISYSGNKIIEFVSESPKQASTSGGVFPALFGTVLMVLLMAVIVAPFGAMAAIYLHEYAPNNMTTSVIRICVSNMAGVPSVVYGVFGLGFFVYTLGGSIDSLLFSDALPSPTFGTPGLFWAALTMALLTLPVVIVSTEEGLRRVPEGLRAGSYALGATKAETIWKTVLPFASPGIMTGVILAIARAAGEVAPLILVGAVKFAPSLPVDSEFPFLHLERQFMHLGVFIYDGAFHNQTNTQGSSMMFASCMLLLIIVFILNLFAIIVRNKLRDRYVRI
jgi:phosphate transport system permease protein